MNVEKQIKGSRNQETEIQNLSRMNRTRQCGCISAHMLIRINIVNNAFIRTAEEWGVQSFCHGV